MANVISFEKFVALHAAGLSEQEIRAMQQAPHMHSSSQDFVQSVAQRAARGKRGY